MIPKKKLHKADELSYKLLKAEIEETFAKGINTSGDCLLLSEEIYAKISFNVNSNTIRRFFGLVKSNYFPSATTLDIFSKYCGFINFDEFKKLRNNKQKTNNQDFNSQSILNYLVALFKNTPAKENMDDTFISVVEQTIYFLQRHPHLVDQFQRAVAKTGSGQDYYYEHFINIDHLNSFYGEGLRYYLMEKKTVEAQIFGHSLLCLRNWLTDNAAGVKKNYEEIIKHHLPKSNHPVLCAFFLGTQLLNAEMFGLPTEKLLIKIQQTHAAIKAHNDSIPYFEHIITPVLLLAGHLKEALFYINYSATNYSQKTVKDISQATHVINALVFVKAGKKREAVKVYQHIYPAAFNFLTKKINMMLYLFLNKYLNKSSAATDRQLHELIIETGFTRLNKF